LLVALERDDLGGGHDDGDAVFTVVADYPDRAASAVARVASRLMDVDDYSVEKSQEDATENGGPASRSRTRRTLR
jgi:hypothetical protein